MNVSERLLLLNMVLPRQGDITTVRIVNKLSQELSFTEEEHSALSFKKPGELTEEGKVVPAGQLVWNKTAETPKEIEIGPKAFSIISERLVELDKQKKLTEAHISLYDKFVENAG